MLPDAYFTYPRRFRRAMIYWCFAAAGFLRKVEHLFGELRYMTGGQR